MTTLTKRARKYGSKPDRWQEPADEPQPLDQGLCFFHQGR